MNPQFQLMLQQAIQAFENGKIESAELMLKRLLQIDKKNLPALHVLGLIKASQGIFRESADYLERAARLNPNDASIEYNLAKALMDCGDSKGAIPHHKKAVELNPKNPKAWLNFGETVFLLKRFDEALEYCDRALLIKPDYYEALNNKGLILYGLKRYDEALEYCDRALLIKPDYYEALSNKGLILHDLKRYEEALSLYDQALHIKPEYFNALWNKSVTYTSLKRFDEALEYCDRALLIKPDYYEALNNKGLILYGLKRYDEALEYCDRALLIKPDYYEALSNKGLILHDLKRYEEALSLYDQALHIKPDYFDALWNKSLVFLTKGDFNKGLPLYENRWLSDQMRNIAGGLREFGKPKWLGNESISGKTILLYGEQGLGDFIQFCRYAKLVSNLGARVLLEVPEPLGPLLANLEGVSEIIVKGKPLPKFDFHIPLLSLPLAFKTTLETIPIYKNYINLDLHANKLIEWNERLGAKIKPRIGLAWSGNPNHQNDQNRSVPLNHILPYLPNEFEYVSLQKEYREQEILCFKGSHQIIDQSTQLHDFLDTAALIDCVDLVISVDTSIAHLSGALGKQTWVLLPFAPDWRWLLDREDSPWYSTIKLYRQSSPGNWDNPLEKIRLDLKNTFK